MADFKHLVVVKFRPDVNVGEILYGIQTLVSCVGTVKPFECYIEYRSTGEDLEGSEMVRQGFTHVFAVIFGSKEGYNAHIQRPAHIKFSAVVAQALDKVVVLNFLGMWVEQKVKASDLPLLHHIISKP
uniref:Stress-response A/B barrel domain-containing protein n=1 Tax=Kalanchoe fedtschenkoi TaxID=63787 RepID=A0A7N0UTR7_KALFE